MLHLAPLSNWTTAVVGGESLPLFPPTFELAGITVRTAPAAWAAAPASAAAAPRVVATPGRVAAPAGPLAWLAAGADDGAYVLPL